MSRDLENKIAIVTGAARGIGFGIAGKLAEKGATVVISDVNEESARQAADKIKDMGGKATYILADVSDFDQAHNLIQSTIEQQGDLHILVNNAGINRDMMLHKMTKESWDAVIAVNLTGVFNCMQPAAVHMREKEYGRIINISSASYLNGNIGQANYSAAKAGVIALTRTAAKELGKKNVTVNAIVPGFIDTEMTRGVPEKAWDIMVSKISMGRAGKPEDIGNMIAFLASDEASYITQGIFEVGGGMVL
ncbi:3-oxoacyl-ACP reductase FabG [Lactonifactor longoviformis]|uniref:3-oxoacyl-ACP reductase FabG n=1 Tax=Lactonifactor longoviformis TaxID=341220 RepID=UPI0036F207F2